MTLEGVASSLEERGIIWQGAGFATVGAISLLLLSVYSEASHWSIGVYSLAVTQLSWAFALSIAIAIEGIRNMFETRTEIRRAARAKAIAKARQEERQAIEKRLRAELANRGIDDVDAFLELIYGSENGHASDE